MKTLRKTTRESIFNRLVLSIFLVVACTVQPGVCADPSGDGSDSAMNRSGILKRDPFWPVGYIPDWIRNAGQKNAVIELEDNGNSDWNAAMKLVVIQGVSSRSGDEFFAIINDEVKSVGEAVSIKFGNNIYSWAVESISPPSSVKLRRISVKVEK